MTYIQTFQISLAFIVVAGMCSCEKVEDLTTPIKKTSTKDELHIQSKYSWVTACVNGKCKRVTDISKHQVIVIADDTIKSFSVFKDAGKEVSVSLHKSNRSIINFGYLKNGYISYAK